MGYQKMPGSQSCVKISPWMVAIRQVFMSAQAAASYTIAATKECIGNCWLTIFHPLFPSTLHISQTDLPQNAVKDDAIALISQP
jgi:hypothetical protein